MSKGARLTMIGKSLTRGAKPTFVRPDFGILSMSISLIFSNVIARLIGGTDVVEVLAFLMSLWGSLFSAWALRRALKMWRDIPPVLPNTEGRVLTTNASEGLRNIALRRVRQQSFHLLVQGIILCTAMITMFLSISEMQSVVRSYAFVILALLMLFRASIEHWEQRSVDYQRQGWWDGKERRMDQQNRAS